jgi:hypothetical protein
MAKLKAVLSSLALLVVALLVLQSVRPFDRAWSTQLGGRPFAAYLALALLLFVIVLISRDRRASGLTPEHPGLQLEVAAAGFLPVAALAITLTYVNWRTWGGAVIAAGVALAALAATAWLIRDKVPAERPTRTAIAILVGGAILSAAAVTAFSSLGSMALAFVFAFLFSAPVEELLFRGLMQGWLNKAFGRPYQTWGVQWGPGLLITALLFGLWHVLAPFEVFTGQYALALPHGLWTFCAGLIFGLVREKTGGIAAPVILHALLNFL